MHGIFSQSEKNNTVEYENTSTYQKKTVLSTLKTYVSHSIKKCKNRFMKRITKIGPLDPAQIVGFFQRINFT